jgi:hypothetical protein
MTVIEEGTMSTELVVAPRQQGIVRAEDFMPVMDFALAVQRRNIIIQVTKDLMNEGVDYGTIPGTQKATLLKPGAEKLCTLFGLSPEFVLEHSEEDWDGSSHNGEAFFYYRYKCRLTRNGILMGECVGSCNSWESKYRYRSSDRKCPACGKATIIRGKAEYGGGWLCFAKKGGCGAKFKDGDASIESQPTGRVPNPDVADVVNTIQKMAQKRSIVGSVLIATNGSEFFTQDIEDMEMIGVPGAIDVPFTATPEPQKKHVQPQKPASQAATAQPPEGPTWEDLGDEIQRGESRPLFQPPVPAVTQAAASQQASAATEAAVMEENVPVSREAVLDHYKAQFSGGTTASRTLLFRDVLKRFQNVLGKDLGEVRYQDWLSTADVAKPQDFKTMKEAREVYMHMVGQILDLEAQHGV